MVHIGNPIKALGSYIESQIKTSIMADKFAVNAKSKIHHMDMSSVPRSTTDQQLIVNIRTTTNCARGQYRNIKANTLANMAEAARNNNWSIKDIRRCEKKLNSRFSEISQVEFKNTVKAELQKDRKQYLNNSTHGLAAKGFLKTQHAYLADSFLANHISISPTGEVRRGHHMQDPTTRAGIASHAGGATTAPPSPETSERQSFF